MALNIHDFLLAKEKSSSRNSIFMFGEELIKPYLLVNVAIPIFLAAQVKPFF